MSYTAIITPEEDGSFSAQVPELPGCYTCGQTLDELRANLREAISLYLEVAPQAARQQAFSMQVNV